ncbi:MAG TPA: hypothetical protein VK821_04290 [Dehalococcoidia bacterium]|nr:hypothetical protein [Dehalococcoidia bacterium]
MTRRVAIGYSSPCSARYTRSAVTGSSNSLAPLAVATALAIAAAVGLFASSPIAFAYQCPPAATFFTNH